jgi:hypothetical protein
MSLAQCLFSPGPRGLQFLLRGARFSRRSQWGAALLFKMFLATQNEPEVDKREII